MYEYVDVWVKDNQYLYDNPNDSTYQYMQILAYRKEDSTYMLAGEYQDQRRMAYNNMDIYNQIDSIYQGFQAIQQAGMVTLPQDTINWINERASIKNNIPKPPEGMPYIKPI